MNHPQKSFFQRFIEQLNFTKFFRDSLVVVSTRAGLVATTLTVSQLVPPDITTVTDFNDWIVDNPHAALQRLWRRRRKIQKRIIAVKSAKAAARGITEKSFEYVLKALLSVHFGRNVESLLVEKYDLCLRRSLDITLYLKTVLFSRTTEFKSTYSVSHEVVVPLYKTIPNQRLASVFRNTEKSFIDNLFVNTSGFFIDRIIDVFSFLKGSLTFLEFFRNMLDGLVEKLAAIVGAVTTNACVSFFIRGDNWFSWGLILVAENLGSDFAVNVAHQIVRKYFRESQKKKKHSKNHQIDDLEQDGGNKITDSETV